MPPDANAPAELETVRRVVGERYRVERELGRGGMGTVYLARDLRLDRPVALKVLPGEFATQAVLRDRFLRETRTAAGFSHPNIVPVYAVEEHDALLGFAMAFLEGETLAERVRRVGPLPVRELVRLLQDVGYALAYAHGRGVVHRDVKPENVMLERATGRALVMDFGVSRPIATPVASVALTRVGEVVGTPEYMSPEQASGDVVDGRSDLYALGLTALFAATGRSQMSAESTQKVLVRQLTEPLTPAASLRADLPPALAAAIDRCVAKDPADRFASAEALVEAIDAAQIAEPAIPIALRLFASELGTLSLLVVGVVGVGAFMTASALEGDRTLLDVLLPLALLGGVLATRTLTTLAELRRLANEGFGARDVLDALDRVLAERVRRRADLRADPVAFRRRRGTVRLAAVLLPGALAMIALAYRMRVPNATGGHRSPPLGVALVFVGLLLLGTGVVLLVRSPFRAPVGERAFRWLWLGPFGRAVIRWGTRTTTRPASATAAAVPASVAAPPAADRLARLEQRVAALERRAGPG